MLTNDQFDALEHSLKVVDERAEPLTPRLLRVLLAVHRPQKAPTEGELIQTLELQRLDISRAVSTLESMLLVRRLHDAETNRYRVFPSTHGERLVRALRYPPTGDASELQDEAA